jgi:hypothetical protein
MAGSYAKARGWGLLVLVVAILVGPECALATYDSNLSGIADSVYTYSSDILLIHPTDQPSSHPSCNPIYFAVDPLASDENAMNRMFVRLMTSYVMQEPIASQGDCVDGYIHVWRMG